MKEIKINTESRNYPVLVGTDILNENNFKEFSNKEILLVIDSKIDESVKKGVQISLSNISSKYSELTIEANEETLTAIKPDLFNRCHIIYRISDPYLEMLKSTDTLSIDAGWYRVHQVTKCNMMEISPDNYKFDEEV